MIVRLRERFDELIWSDMLYAHGMPGRLLVNVLRYIVALIRDMSSDLPDRPPEKPSIVVRST